MTTLLDSNVLIALAVHEHVHHDAAIAWLVCQSDPVATCPITQGAMIRMLLRRGVGPDQALNQLGIIAAQPRHEFWPDQVPFTDVALAGVIGHRQITDAYLAQLARSRTGRLATFDQGLAQLHADVAHLVPTG
ncbi:MAG: VapC toxin family PIN domain ribonuclease [Pseudonocardiales bacterium]|nr:MAG: VapC toxin family PIN domain ribonuclease [Pseudonocardiales bacterium]